MITPKSSGRSYACIIASMIIVGSNIGVGRMIAQSLPPEILTTLRFGIAGSILLTSTFIFPVINWKEVFARVELKTLFQVVLLALFGSLLFTLMMLAGTKRTTLLEAGLIISTLPAVVAVFAFFFLKEKIDLRNGLAIILSVASVSLISLAPKPEVANVVRTSALVGNLLIIAAVCCEALYVILSRSLSAKLKTFEICIFTQLSGFFLSLPLGIQKGLHFNWAGMPRHVWFLIFWYAVSASILSFFLWIKGIQNVAANHAAILTAIIPVTAAIFGIIFFKERLNSLHILAFCTVLVAILLASSSGKKK